LTSPPPEPLSEPKTEQRRWLVLRFEAPMLSFGAVAIDHRGVTWDFPGLSMLTGLFANALGWDRNDRETHQVLQDRIVYAARREREPYRGVLRDTQNAQLESSDKGWTTRGQPEGRDGGNLSAAPHRRQRDYHPDALIAVVVTLKAASGVDGTGPTLDELAGALDRPARPLFIGRKPCLPSAPLRERQHEGALLTAPTAHAALALLPLLLTHGEIDKKPRQLKQAMPLRALWPAGEGPSSGSGVDRTVAIADRRNWISGLHGGSRLVVEGSVMPSSRAEVAP
jgi:CRISPR system Cascade subunit CasD